MMACPTKNQNEPVLMLSKDRTEVPLHIARLKVCECCPRNVEGICRTVAAKHGKQKAVISDGVRRFSVSCPKGKWLAIKVVCPSCDRYALVDERTGVCEWCKIKQEMGRNNRVYYLNDNRDHSIVPMPFEKDPIKHLHYFLYPKYEKSVEYHIGQLERSMSVFNGEKICCVAIDSNTKQEKYEKKLNELFTEVYYVQNNPSLREKAGFVSSLEKLRSKDPEEMICFAHGKGQQIHTKSAPVIRKWSDAMYDTCFRNVEKVTEAMEQGYPIAGSFKSIGAFRTTRYKWHYSGSFWWGRSRKIFENKNWKNMCDQWWSTESYVGRHFTREEGYCLFGNDVGNLYEAHTWNRIEPSLEQWRKSQNVLS